MKNLNSLILKTILVSSCLLQAGNAYAVDNYSTKGIVATMEMYTADDKPVIGNLVLEKDEVAANYVLKVNNLNHAIDIYLTMTENNDEGMIVLINGGRCRVDPSNNSCNFSILAREGSKHGRSVATLAAEGVGVIALSTDIDRISLDPNWRRMITLEAPSPTPEGIKNGVGVWSASICEKDAFIDPNNAAGTCVNGQQYKIYFNDNLSSYGNYDGMTSKRVVTLPEEGDYAVNFAAVDGAPHLAAIAYASMNVHTGNVASINSYTNQAYKTEILVRRIEEGDDRQ